MNQDIVAAKKILDTNISCVICYKGAVFTNDKPYNKAIIEFFNSGFDFSMFSIAITDIDLFTAAILKKLKIKGIFSYKISRKSLDLLNKENVEIYYNEIIDEELEDFKENMDIDEYIVKNRL